MLQGVLLGLRPNNYLLEVYKLKTRSHSGLAALMLAGLNYIYSPLFNLGHYTEPPSILWLARLTKLMKQRMWKYIWLITSAWIQQGPDGLILAIQDVNNEIHIPTTSVSLPIKQIIVYSVVLEHCSGGCISIAGKWLTMLIINQLETWVVFRRRNKYRKSRRQLNNVHIRRLGEIKTGAPMLRVQV